MAPTVPLAPAVAALTGAAASRPVAGTWATRVTLADDSDVAQSDVAREEGAFVTVPDVECEQLSYRIHVHCTMNAVITGVVREYK